MCMFGGPDIPAAPVAEAPPPAPEPPPPPSATAATVKQQAAANPLMAKKKSKNPLRIDRSPSYDSGSGDSVATGLNIPV
jgi:hypothetical protein